MHRCLRYKVMLTAIFAMCLVFPTFTYAKFANPLIMTYQGDLWAWDGVQIERRTTWTQNFPPVISPNGAWIAYKSVAKVAIDAIAAFGHPGGGGELPATIWLLNVATNDAIRIGDQPLNAQHIQSKFLGYLHTALRSYMVARRYKHRMD
jgi:hypothetical protein